MFALVKPYAPFSAEAFDTLYKSLDLTVKGMSAIFVVIFIFYVIIKILGKMPIDKK